MELNAATISLLFFVFALAMFLGVELIRKVPSQLHTPLMSGSNAISGITIVGALLALGHEGSGVAVTVLAGLAVAFAMINVVGGYLVTDRMLGMFRSKEGGKRKKGTFYFFSMRLPRWAVLTRKSRMFPFSSDGVKR